MWSEDEPGGLGGHTVLLSYDISSGHLLLALARVMRLWPNCLRGHFYLQVVGSRFLKIVTHLVRSEVLRHVKWPLEILIALLVFLGLIPRTRIVALGYLLLENHIRKLTQPWATDRYLLGARQSFYALLKFESRIMRGGRPQFRWLSRFNI